MSVCSTEVKFMLGAWMCGSCIVQETRPWRPRRGNTALWTRSATGDELVSSL